LRKALFCSHGKRHNHARAETQHFGYRGDLRLIQAHPEWNRTRLSRELCALWD
jgi:hypothetical protein